MTTPARAYGLITRVGIRWALTWSAPSWESSSTTKIAEEDQIDEREIVSTSCPSAWSLSAIMAFGVGKPGWVPRVWSLVMVR
jgi:hypothetical protein